jgi:hypothetical protein
LIVTGVADDNTALSEIRLVLKECGPAVNNEKITELCRSSINIILKVNPSGPVIVTVPVATAQVGLLSRQLLVEQEPLVVLLIVTL